MNNYRSVWDSLTVSNDPIKLSDKPSNHKTSSRRNGEVTSPNNVTNLTKAHSGNSDIPVKNIQDKCGHSDSVFDYLRELQSENGHAIKGILKTNNAAPPEEPAPASTLSQLSQDTPDDRQLSASSTDGCSMRLSPSSQGQMETQETTATLPPPASTPKVFRVDVKETYQFAFVMNNDSASMAIPECADSFEASYQIQGSLDKNGAMDIPVNFEPQLFLAENRNSFDEFLQDAIDSFLHEVQCQVVASRQLVYLNHAMSCYHESVALRQKVFVLMCTILPDLSFQTHFDCTSPHTEKFIDYLLEILSGESSDNDNTHDMDVEPESSIRDCYVDLCDDPVLCLTKLKRKILRVIRALLPQLQLPEAFDINTDLFPLLKSIIQCSR